MITNKCLKVKVWGWIALVTIGFYAIGIPWVLASEASESANLEAEVPTEVSMPTKAESEPVAEAEGQTGDGVSVSVGVTDVNTTLVGESTLVVEGVTPESSQSAVNIPEIARSENSSPSAEVDEGGLPSTELVIANVASVSSVVQAEAETGNVTQVSEKGEVRASTGQASALANNVTLVNTTLVNSQLWIGTLGITANWAGDIYIPVPQLTSENLSQNGIQLQIDNQGNVQTSTTASATSGEILQKSSGGEVVAETGAAIAVASDVVVAGMTLIESDVVAVLVENLWLWSGLIYNWREPGSVDSPQDVWQGQARDSECLSTPCRLASVTITNSADVETTTSASARSGGVEQTTAGGGAVAETGTARALASATTIVNTTLVNSSLRLLNLLLAAEWSGNLIFVYPEEDLDPEPSPTPSPAPETSKPTESDQAKTETEVPELRLSATHNAEHGIYAGDGVTYDVEIYNNGPITAQNVYLLQDFYDTDGRIVSRMKAKVGEIGLNRRRTVHFVLKTGSGAGAGEYRTMTVAEGEGESGAVVSSNTVNQTFQIIKRLVIMPVGANEREPSVEVVEIPDMVLGATTQQCQTCLAIPWYVAIWLGSLLYYGVSIKRTDWKRVMRYGCALPLSAYAGLWYSNPSCRSGLGMLGTNPWCEWFLIVALAIYYLNGVIMKRLIKIVLARRGH